MYSRIINYPKSQSFFLFGPRGTGKTWWVKQQFPDSIYIDLLASTHYTQLLAEPQRLENLIPPTYKNWIIIDEVQKIPALLDEVHRLIENKKLKFILTGSSARKFKQKGVNLLAGRALTHYSFPLTAQELGSDFNIKNAMQFGTLPMALASDDPASYLKSYVKTYLQEEIQQEGLTRNLGAFARFLETASFSQASLLNVSEVARECAVERKVVENYFSILDDLLLAIQIPAFTKRAKRRKTAHPKFYFFDAGVFQSLRPQGPLDSPGNIMGLSLETLVLQELRALNHYLNLDYTIHYWRDPSDNEVDFVLYGNKGIRAFEVKASSRIRSSDLKGIKMFLQSYPMTKATVLYGGNKKYYDHQIEIIPLADFFKSAAIYLA